MTFEHFKLADLSAFFFSDPHMVPTDNQIVMCGITGKVIRHRCGRMLENGQKRFIFLETINIVYHQNVMEMFFIYF